jgi:hypothetical protein
MAVLAVAASLRTAIYHMHKVETLYEDPDPNHFDARTKERQNNRVLRRLADLGRWVRDQPGAFTCAGNVRAPFGRQTRCAIADRPIRLPCWSIHAGSRTTTPSGMRQSRALTGQRASGAALRVGFSVK